MNSSEKIALSQCIDGILYNKGFIKDLDDLNQVASMRELRIILKNAPVDERERMIEKGEFNEYKKL